MGVVGGDRVDRGQPRVARHMLPGPVLRATTWFRWVSVEIKLSRLPADSGLGVGGWGRWGRRRLEEVAKDRSGKRRPLGKAECSPRIFC